MLNNSEKASAIYSVILKEVKPLKRCFAFSIPVYTSIIQCKNVHVHSYEKTFPLELLAIRLALHFPRITRLELYYVTGRAPALLDKDLEKLRAEGYLEYAIPFDRIILEKNLDELESNLNDEIIIQEELERLKNRIELKQYVITDLGRELARTGKKNALEEGNLDFIFIREENGWVSVAHETKRGYRWKYQSIPESDFGFWETYLKSFKDHLSDTKIFRELTLSSKINVDDLQNSFLWLLYPERIAYLQTNVRIFQINLKNSYDVPLDSSDFEKELSDIKIPLELLSTDLPENSPIGVTYAINLKTPHECKDVFTHLMDNIKSNWCTDIVIEGNDILGVIRLLLVPKSVEAFEELVFLMLQKENNEGALKFRRNWVQEIERQFMSLQKFSDYQGSKENILNKILSPNNLFIAEEVVENHIRSLYSGNIEKLTVIEKNKKISAFCVLEESKFLSEYQEKRLDEEFEVMNRMSEVGPFSQPYILFLCSSNRNEFLGAMLARSLRSQILTQSEISNRLRIIEKRLPEELQIEAEIDVLTVISSIRGPLNDDVLIAEELITTDIDNSDLINIVESFETVKVNNRLVVFCQVKKEFIQSLFENHLMEFPGREILVKFSTECETPEGLRYSIRTVVEEEEEEDAGKIAILRLTETFKGKLTNLSALRREFKINIKNMCDDSKLPIIEYDDTEISQAIAKARRFAAIYLEEEEIQKDLETLFGGRRGFIDLDFNYTGTNLTKANIGITQYGLENLHNNAHGYIYGITQDRRIEVLNKELKYRISPYPANKETMVLFIGKKLQHSILASKKLWRISEIRKRSVRYFKNLNKTAKRKIEEDDGSFIAIIETLRENGVLIYDDLVTSSLRNLCDFTNINSELVKGDRIRVTVSTSDIVCLLKNRVSIITNPENEIEDRFNEIAYSYKVQLIPADLPALRRLVIERIWIKHQNQYPSESNLKNYLQQIAKEFQSIGNLKIDSNFYETAFLELKTRGLITAEKMIKDTAEDFLNSYSEIEITEKTVLVYISKRKFKDFRKRVLGKKIASTFKLNVNNIGNIEIKLIPLDKTALLGIIVLSLYDYRQESDDRIFSEASDIFDDLVKNDKLAEKEKMKLLSEKEKLLSKVVQQVKKLK